MDTASPTATRSTAPQRAGAGLAQVVQADLGLGTVVGGPQVEGADRAWVLVRVFGRPVGVAETPLGLSPSGRRPLPAALRDALLSEVDPGDLRDRSYLDPLEGPVEDLTVVICTRGNPAGVSRLLDSLAAQHDPRFTVLVCDNAPTDDALVPVVAAFETRLDVRRVVAPLPGLSRARNAALGHVQTPLVAWLDDDETADPWWSREVLRSFLDPAVDAVSGIVLPRELDTAARLWFEQFGGHSKGRGFRPDRFRAAAGAQSPLYPLPAFGVGANMSFRTAVLRRLGGAGGTAFDPALGAGTRSSAGEDTLVLTRVLLAGGTIDHRPGAVTWHSHRYDVAGLEKQLAGYGRGLTAYYSALLLRDPRRLLPLLRLLPDAARDLRPGGSAMAGVGADFPPSVLSARRRGLLSGPWAYVRTRWDQRGAPP